MNHKTYNFWTTQIQIFDNFIEDKNIYGQLNVESIINESVDGQDEYKLTTAQQNIFNMVTPVVNNYCIENDIDCEALKFSNLQKGCLYKYDQAMSTTHLYEPHHDMVENSYITAIYYINSSYSEDMWVGGELSIYKQLTFADYPKNTINILPKPNRLIIFPGFLVHRVKPYFGDLPRTSLVFGWELTEKKNLKSIIL
jgi:hypothetical protein